MNDHEQGDHSAALLFFSTPGMSRDIFALDKQINMIGHRHPLAGNRNVRMNVLHTCGDLLLALPNFTSSRSRRSRHNFLLSFFFLIFVIFNFTQLLSSLDFLHLLSSFGNGRLFSNLSNHCFGF
ncbi:hypothetical protein KCU77_g65, partial [Aureobasidium melanogenum]